MNPVERVLRRVDRFQQEHRPLGFVFGVVKKFGDDRGGSLAAVLAYYGFISLFPLLLVVVTVLGFVLHGNESLQRDLIDSALGDFPVIGTQLRNNVKALGGNGLALAIGLAASLWGALGVTQAAQNTMAEVWAVPERDRPGFVPRLARGLLLFTVLGLAVVATTWYASFGTVEQGGALALLNLTVTVVLNVLLWTAAFRILTPRQITTRTLVPGAALAGIAWTLLQLLGTYLISRQLRHTSEVYGFFAIVLGLLWWLYLAALIAVYCAEVNAVLSKRLWPRSLIQPPLTGPDQRALRDAAKAKERYPEQEVDVTFTAPPAPPAPTASEPDQ
jgi:YihY family inner membrane protein